MTESAWLTGAFSWWRNKFLDKSSGFFFFVLSFTYLQYFYIICLKNVLPCVNNKIPYFYSVFIRTVLFGWLLLSVSLFLWNFFEIYMPLWSSLFLHNFCAMCSGEHCTCFTCTPSKFYINFDFKSLLKILFAHFYVGDTNTHTSVFCHTFDTTDTMVMKSLPSQFYTYISTILIHLSLT